MVNQVNHYFPFFEQWLEKYTAAKSYPVQKGHKGEYLKKTSTGKRGGIIVNELEKNEIEDKIKIKEKNYILC